MARETGSNYKFSILGTSMNSHPIKGSSKFDIGFLDSGTTFTYLPHELYNSLLYHMKFFCQNANRYDNNDSKPGKYCPGGEFNFYRIEGERVACVNFDGGRFNSKVKDFFLGYPYITFHVKQVDGKIGKINWYPSEYFYLAKTGDKYCLAAEEGSDYQIMFGSTLMRQTDFIFDIQNKQIGVARADCSNDPLMILNEYDYGQFGYPFPREE